MDMDIKMIVCDLDGTLLRSDKTVTRRTLDALDKCRRQGIIFAVATARSVTGARMFTDHMMPDALVYNGGSAVQVAGIKIYENPMPSGLVSVLVNELLGRGVTNFSAENDEGYFYHGNRYEYADYLKGFGLTIGQINPEGQMPPLHKLTAEISGDKAKQIVEKYLEIGIVTYTDTQMVRFARKDATKWHGIKVLAEHFGVNTANIVAFGDDNNDLDMLENCGIGVAMGNAINEAKTTANFICDTNDKDGVARWLEEKIW